MDADDRFYRVGDYVLKETIGVGNYGKVKVAVHVDTGEKYACKILEKTYLQEQKNSSQLVREVEIMRSLDHPNTVSLVAVLASPYKIFIIMELITGGELFREILRHKRLSEPYARFYFRQLLDGLEYCHRNGVYHRDLKPENLLLDQTRTLKISDFGLSSLKTNGSTMTESAIKAFTVHTQCGTPNYVAPEIVTLDICGGGSYRAALVDAWACGVILYVLVSGTLPFDSTDTNILFRRILTGTFEFPTYFSPEIRDLISKLLTVKPSQRYSLADVRRHPWFLNEHIENHMPGEVPPPPPPYAARWFRPHQSRQTEISSHPLENEAPASRSVKFAIQSPHAVGVETATTNRRDVMHQSFDLVGASGEPAPSQVQHPTHDPRASSPEASSDLPVRYCDSLDLEVRAELVDAEVPVLLECDTPYAEQGTGESLHTMENSNTMVNSNRSCYTSGFTTTSGNDSYYDRTAYGNNDANYNVGDGDNYEDEFSDYSDEYDESGDGLSTTPCTTTNTAFESVDQEFIPKPIPTEAIDGQTGVSPNVIHQYSHPQTAPVASNLHDETRDMCDMSQIKLQVQQQAMHSETFKSESDPSPEMMSREPRESMFLNRHDTGYTAPDISTFPPKADSREVHFCIDDNNYSKDPERIQRSEAAHHRKQSYGGPQLQNGRALPRNLHHAKHVPPPPKYADRKVRKTRGSIHGPGFHIRWFKERTGSFSDSPFQDADEDFQYDEIQKLLAEDDFFYTGQTLVNPTMSTASHNSRRVRSLNDLTSDVRIPSSIDDGMDNDTERSNCRKDSLQVDHAHRERRSEGQSRLASTQLDHIGTVATDISAVRAEQPKRMANVDHVYSDKYPRSGPTQSSILKSKSTSEAMNNEAFASYSHHKVGPVENAPYPQAFSRDSSYDNLTSTQSPKPRSRTLSKYFSEPDEHILPGSDVTKSVSHASGTVSETSSALKRQKHSRGSFKRGEKMPSSRRTHSRKLGFSSADETGDGILDQYNEKWVQSQPNQNMWTNYMMDFDMIPNEVEFGMSTKELDELWQKGIEKEDLGWSCISKSNKDMQTSAVPLTRHKINFRRKILESPKMKKSGKNSRSVREGKVRQSLESSPSMFAGLGGHSKNTSNDRHDFNTLQTDEESREGVKDCNHPVVERRKDNVRSRRTKREVTFTDSSNGSSPVRPSEELPSLQDPDSNNTCSHEDSTNNSRQCRVPDSHERLTSNVITTISSEEGRSIKAVSGVAGDHIYHENEFGNLSDKLDEETKIWVKTEVPTEVEVPQNDSEVDQTVPSSNTPLETENRQISPRPNQTSENTKGAVHPTLEDGTQDPHSEIADAVNGEVDEKNISGTGSQEGSVILDLTGSGPADLNCSPRSVRGTSSSLDPEEIAIAVNDSRQTSGILDEQLSEQPKSNIAVDNIAAVEMSTLQHDHVNPSEPIVTGASDHDVKTDELQSVQEGDLMDSNDQKQAQKTPMSPFEFDIPAPKGMIPPSRTLFTRIPTLRMIMRRDSNGQNPLHNGLEFRSLLKPADCCEILIGVLISYGCSAVQSEKVKNRWEIKCKRNGAKGKVRGSLHVFTVDEEGLSTIQFHRRFRLCAKKDEEFQSFFNDVFQMFGDKAEKFAEHGTSTTDSQRKTLHHVHSTLSNEEDTSRSASTSHLGECSATRDSTIMDSRVEPI